MKIHQSLSTFRFRNTSPSEKQDSPLYIKDQAIIGERDLFGNEITQWYKIKKAAGRIVDDHPVALVLGTVALGVGAAVAISALCPGIGSSLSSFIDPGNPASPLSPASPLNPGFAGNLLR